MFKLPKVNFGKTKYRVATDAYAGWEAQVWRWWYPIWTPYGDLKHRSFTFTSKEDAIQFIRDLGHSGDIEVKE